MGFRTSRFWFPTIPLSCHPNYRALTFALAGLSPAEHTSLSWLQPLRQRMIEDMAGRKLNPHTQRSHIHSYKRFAAWLKHSPVEGRFLGKEDVLRQKLTLEGFDIVTKHIFAQREFPMAGHCLDAEQ